MASNQFPVPPPVAPIQLLLNPVWHAPDRNWQTGSDALALKPQADLVLDIPQVSNQAVNPMTPTLNPGLEVNVNLQEPMINGPASNTHILLFAL